MFCYIDVIGLTKSWDKKGYKGDYQTMTPLRCSLRDGGVAQVRV
jgi:hypothetical protein